MKHETFNSIIAGAGLLLATFTAWNQFRPSPDNITLVSEGKVGTQSLMQVNKFGPPIYANKNEDLKTNPTIGPVLWKLRVFNKMDRNVSIVGSDVFLLTQDNRRMQFTGIGGIQSVVGVDPQPVIFPQNIPANEGRSYIVNLRVPIAVSEPESEPCLQEEQTLRDIEVCFYSRGRDLFGNEVRANFDPNDPDNFFHASWPSGQSGPRFLITLQTGDGSRFQAELSYFPTVEQYLR